LKTIPGWFLLTKSAAFGKIACQIITDITKEMIMQQRIKKIEAEIWRRWTEVGKTTGFTRLNLAYRFFTATTEEGEMVFCKHCEHTHDMRCGSDGKDDFNRFVFRRINFADRQVNYATDECEKDLLDDLAESVADAYVSEQAHRLASYIVRISGMEITNEPGEAA